MDAKKNYPKVSFTSLLLKVVERIQLAPKLRLKNSISKLRRKERKLLTSITGSWKSFKLLFSRKLIQDKKPAGKRSSHVDKRWEIHRQKSWNCSGKNIILGDLRIYVEFSYYNGLFCKWNNSDLPTGFKILQNHLAFRICTCTHVLLKHWDIGDTFGSHCRPYNKVQTLKFNF